MIFESMRQKSIPPTSSLSSTGNAARGSLPSGMWRKRRAKLVNIAISLLQTATVASRDIFHPSMFCLHVKNASRPHQHPPNMHSSRIELCRNCRFHQVAGTKSSNSTWAFGLATREPKFVYIHHLSRLSAFGFNQPRPDVCGAQALWRGGADDCRVDPVGFRQRQPGSIPACASSGANFYRQTERFQFLIQPPARGIHRSRIGQWRFHLQLNMCQQFWSVGKKRLDRLISLGLVTRLAGDHEIRHAVRTAARAWMHMVHFESSRSRGTIRALMLPLD